MLPMKKLSILTLLFSLIATWSAAQSVIGTWRTFPVFDSSRIVTQSATHVYGGSETAIFEWDKTDNSFYTYDKTNRLSDIQPTAMNFHDELDFLMVGYENGNLDILYPNYTKNLSDIKRASSITGNKTINRITYKDSIAYLSCGFGIVLLDLIKSEIIDTYKIGNNGTAVNVWDVAFLNGNIYAATDEGIKYAPLSNQFLANYQNWTLETTIPAGEYNEIEEFDGKLFANHWVNEFDNPIYEYIDGVWSERTFPSRINRIYNLINAGETFIINAYYKTHLFSKDDLDIPRKTISLPEQRLPRDMVYLGDDHIWYSFGKNGYGQYNGSEFLPNYPNGPSSIQTYSVSAYDGEIWISAGAVDNTFSNEFNAFGVSGLVDGRWVSYSMNNNTYFNNRKFFDALQVIINPENVNEVFCGSFFGGLAEFQNGEFVEIYQNDNSPIAPRLVWTESTSVPSVAVDYHGNVWACNSNTEHPFIVRTPAKEWIGIPIPSISPEDLLMHKMLAASNDYIYGVRPKGGGLLVFNSNGTLSDISDDQVKTLTATINEGGLPSNNIYCVTEDADGEIWVGTDKGPAIFFNPNVFFSDEDINAQQILIEQDGNVQIVLETELVQDIEIDGGNRKWIATANSGAFLLSEDGSDILENFTTDNSPLPSNNILDIAIDHKTGEIFFGTPEGLVGLKGDATESLSGDENPILVIPNPVKPSFDGNITFRGLFIDSEITVTDIAGNQIVKLSSNGGSAVWDGRNLKGDKVNPGIYLIYSTNQDGSEQRKGKFVIER